MHYGSQLCSAHWAAVSFGGFQNLSSGSSVVQRVCHLWDHAVPAALSSEVKCLLFEVFFPFVRFYSVPPHSILSHPILFFPSFPTPFKPISFRSKQYEFGSSTMSRKIAGRRARKKRTFECLITWGLKTFTSPLQSSSVLHLKSERFWFELGFQSWLHGGITWRKNRHHPFRPPSPTFQYVNRVSLRWALRFAKKIKLQSGLRTTGLDGL